jgi:hypothetical protein
VRWVGRRCRCRCRDEIRPTHSSLIRRVQTQMIMESRMLSVNELERGPKELMPPEVAVAK